MLGSSSKLDLTSLTASVKVNTFEHAFVRDLRECRHTLEYAVSTAERGIYLSLVVARTMLFVRQSVMQANCQETKLRDAFTKHYKSQHACSTAVAPGNTMNADKMIVHPLCWSSINFPTYVVDGDMCVVQRGLSVAGDFLLLFST